MSKNGMIGLEESKGIHLSDNFTLYEFLKSDTATRLGIDNSLPMHMLDGIQYLVVTVLQPIRDKFGPIRILSGYRCEELTLAVGSSVKSNHVRGLAADIEPYDSNIKLSNILNYIYEELDYKELIAEFFPNGWVHVAADASNNKKDLKLKDSEYNYARVSIDKILNKYNIVA